MNNRKQMGNPEGAEAELAAEEAARTSPSWGLSHKAQEAMGSEIRNLPDNLSLTKDRLLNNICRICATYHEAGPKMLPLFYYDKGTRPLAKLVNTLLSVKVVAKDGLPKFACRECACKLFTWSAMRDSAADVQKMLLSQAELLDRGHQHRIIRSEKSDLTDTVESVLATYTLNISSMELVCLECDSKTSREEFPHHLTSKHCLKSQEDVEAFVRDHVTFDERLDSEDDTSFVSTEAFDGQCFDCPICNTAFPTRSRLSQHLTIHDVSTDSTSCGGGGNNTELIANSKKDPTNPLQCKSCSHLASDTTALVTHSTHCTNDPLPRDETNQKRIPAVCPDCNRTFSNKYNMLTHMKTHRETSKFDCECGKSYSTRGNLLAHVRIAHSGRLLHACSACGEGFPTRSARDVHSRLHTGARPFVCARCARSFRAKNSLDKHRETHEPRRHECQLCGKKFRRRSHLRSAESPREDSPARASDDSESAPLAPRPADPLAPLRHALRALRDHYAARHAHPAPARAPAPASGEEEEEEEGERDPDRYDDLSCDNMRRDRFDEATRRALDEARIRVDGRTLYACAECGRRLASPHALLNHARIHSGERPQVCHVCGKRFRFPSGLARHLAETHERRRRRACPRCRVTLANDANLRQHLRTHTGERPFQCATCGKRFAQSGSLHAHRRTHEPRRTHACADCGAAFRLRAGLARHARAHAGYRPHRCPCGRAFAAPHELRAHAALHAERAPHACALCPAAYKLRRALRDHVRRAHPAPDLTPLSFPEPTPT